MSPKPTVKSVENVQYNEKRYSLYPSSSWRSELTTQLLISSLILGKAYHKHPTKCDRRSVVKRKVISLEKPFSYDDILPKLMLKNS